MLPLRSALADPTHGTALALVLEAVAAAAQGLLALSLGGLARFLADAPKPAAGGAGMTWMSRGAVGMPLPWGASAATTAAVVGLFAVMLRGGACLVLEARETRDAAGLAARVRRAILEAALVGVRGVSIGAAVTWPGEVELGARGERARLRAIVHLAVLAIVIVALDAALAALVVALLAPFALLLRPVRRALRRAHASASQGAIATVDASRDVVEHAAMWATCGARAVVVRRVDALSEEGAALSARAAAQRTLASTSNEILAAIAVVVLVFAFAPGAAWPRPMLVPVLIALVSTYRPIRDLAEASAAIDRGARALEALGALGALGVSDARASLTSSVVAKAPFAPAPLSARGLAVDVGGDVARGGIDFDASPGAVVAIVGPPGTGKSALLEAIAGVRASRGALSFGGRSLAGAGVGPSERPIAWVPPSPPVLPGTLAENLAPDAPDDAARIEAARAVLRALGDETIVALPDDASLGPRGRAVSSGEAQRISLARALASLSPALLLDEPTANLDAEGERRAIATLREAARERSIVLVTHRQAPLSLATTVIDLAGSGQRLVGAAEAERRIA